MRTDWDKSIEFVLRMEGGATAENVSGDSGGWTKFGISQKAYPTRNIKNLTLDEAREIYMRDYWLACGGDDLPWPFSVAVFDCAVNMGVKTSIRMLQLALEVVVDGVVGEKTITAAKQATPGRIRKVFAIRLGEYAKIIMNNPTQLKFAIDWHYRVISLAELIWKSQG